MSRSYQDKIDAGLCVWCSRPAAPGLRRCAQCHTSANERQRQRHGARRRYLNCPI